MNLETIFTLVMIVMVLTYLKFARVRKESPDDNRLKIMRALLGAVLLAYLLLLFFHAQAIFPWRPAWCTQMPTQQRHVITMDEIVFITGLAAGMLFLAACLT